VEQYHIVVFEQQGEAVTVGVNASAEEDSRFCKPPACVPPQISHIAEEATVVLVAGLPLDQKVVQYGPFVLNSQEQVHQAMLDYQSHSNGFERAAGWESKIGKNMVH